MKIARIVVLALLTALPLVALAQQAAPEAAAAAAAAAPAAAPGAKMESSMTLWGLWVVGGWAMYPILLVSVIATAFTVYGYINFGENKMVREDLIPKLRDAVKRLDIAEASTICTANPGVMSRILNNGLVRLSGDSLDVVSVEKAMTDTSVEENQAGLKPLNYISVCASIAPMFGLLGTVSGMIKAFQKIGLGAMGDPEKLANDIGEAMITTAYGLIVGIPAMFFYFYLKGKFAANMAKIGRLLGDVLHDLGESLKRSDGAPVPASVPAPAKAEQE